MTQPLQKIIVFANYFPPHVGGLERYVEGLMTEVAAVSPYEVHILTHKDRSLTNAGAIHEIKNKLQIHRIDSILNIADVLCIPHPIQLWRSLQSFRIENIRCISIHTRFFPLSFLGALWGWFIKRPVIYTEHGSDHVRFPSSRMIEFFAKLYDFTLGKLTILFSTIKTGASESSCTFVRRLGGKDVRLLENAVDLNFWTQRRSTCYQHYIYVGRIASGKGWDVAVSSHQSLPSSLRSTHPLYLIGDGAESEALKRMVKNDPHIQFLGVRDRETIRDYLVNGILLNPTQLSESLQTILLEAAAAGSWILSSFTVEADRFLIRGFGRIVLDNWQQAMIEAVQIQPPSVSPSFLEEYSWKKRAEQFLSYCDEFDGVKEWKKQTGMHITPEITAESDSPLE